MLIDIEMHVKLIDNYDYEENYGNHYSFDISNALKLSV